MTIEDRKSILLTLRKQNPENYPLHFDQLLDDGYIYLYDYLIKMTEFSTRHERNAEIEKMKFSSLSSVVLEMMDAIIHKVEKAVPSDSQNVLFLLGATGAGKSTTLSYLRGDKMTLKDFHYESQNEKDTLIGQSLSALVRFYLMLM